MFDFESKRIKKIDPDVLIIFGGPHVPDYETEKFLRKYKQIDLAVHGEGEQTLTEIIENYKTSNWSQISGLSFIDNNNHFMGGSISPGVKMRYDSLNHYTANLPLLKNENNFNYPGDSTNASIHAGIIGGVSNEINGFIKQINSRNDKVNVILTGGDAKILSKTLKITIFANQNFILDGLNSILNLNKE